MLRRAALLGLGIVFAVPSGAMAEDKVIASGTILAGGPHTQAQSAAALGVDGVDGFVFDGPAGGTVIESRTADNTGFGYDIDFYFYDAGGRYISGCYEAGSEESCTVPAGAASTEVVSWIGFDLEVDVLDVTPVQP